MRFLFAALTAVGIGACAPEEAPAFGYHHLVAHHTHACCPAPVVATPVAVQYVQPIRACLVRCRPILGGYVVRKKSVLVVPMTPPAPPAVTSEEEPAAPQ